MVSSELPGSLLPSLKEMFSCRTFYVSSWRGGAKHAGNLLSDQATGTSWLDTGHALDGTGFPHERPVEAGGNTGHHRSVLAREVALGQRH